LPNQGRETRFQLRNAVRVFGLLRDSRHEFSWVSPLKRLRRSVTFERLLTFSRAREAQVTFGSDTASCWRRSVALELLFSSLNKDAAAFATARNIWCDDFVPQTADADSGPEPTPHLRRSRAIGANEVSQMLHHLRGA